MHRETVSVLLALLIIGTPISTINLQPIRANGTIYIRADGNIDPPTALIQRDGDVYRFTGNISDSIAIERDNIVLDCGGYWLTVDTTDPIHVTDQTGFRLFSRINVTVTNVHVAGLQGYYPCGFELIDCSRCQILNTIVSNLTLYGIGIVLGSCIQCTVSNNTVTEITTGFAIALANSSKNVVARNTLMNTGFGVVLMTDVSSGRPEMASVGPSVNNSVIGNRFESNKNSMTIYESPHNTLRDNQILNNEYNMMFVLGSSLQDYIQDIDSSNTIDGRPMYYWSNRQNEQVPSDAGFIAVVNSTNIRIEDATLKRGQIVLAYTNNSLVQNTQAEDIFLFRSSGNVIIKNNVTATRSVGIWLNSSSHNEVRLNIVTGNTTDTSYVRGIALEDSFQNVIAYNSLADFGGDGIGLTQSYNNEVMHNSLKNSGVALEESFDNKLENNIIVFANEGNSDYHNGMTIWNSQNNRISENTILKARYGLYLSGSSANTIIHNNFIVNHDIVSIGNPSMDVWDDGYPSGGNYWADYVGSDQNDDGIGDVFYVIDASSRDNYPLIYVCDTLSVLDAGSSEAFQLSLEPITGEWGTPSVEYRVAVREIVDFGIDVLDLFDSTAAGPIKVIWTVITIDVNGDGRINETEYYETLKPLAQKIAEKLAEISYEQDLQLYSLVAQSSIETFAYGAVRAATAASVLVAAINPHSLASMMAPVFVCGGIGSFASGFDLCSVSVLYRDHQTTTSLSPVELEFITDDGLVLNRTVNDIPGAAYIVRDLDSDGDLDGRAVLPNVTRRYSMRVIPKIDVSPTDVYTLTIGADYFEFKLISNAVIGDISRSGYSYSTYVIPEFHSAIMLPLLIMMTLIFALVRKKLLNKDDQSIAKERRAR